MTEYEGINNRPASKIPLKLLSSDRYRQLRCRPPASRSLRAEQTTALGGPFSVAMSAVFPMERMSGWHPHGFMATVQGFGTRTSVLDCIHCREGLSRGGESRTVVTATIISAEQLTATAALAQV